MLVFPNCKINLGLTISGKRDDGYHNIETVFYPIPLHDALEILPDHNYIPTACNNEGLEFFSLGIPVNGNGDENLCVKAYLLLKNDFPALPPVSAYLYKAIPIGAGLGGGSADGAFMLSCLNKQFNLSLSAEQLKQYALKLGSDCPFFIINKPCIGTGRGEILEPINLDLSAYQLMLVNPGIHVNTGWAFSQLQPSQQSASTSSPLKELVLQPVENWKDNLFNQFEEPVFKKYSQISRLKESMYTNGAVYASMSGSGSSVFGLFPKSLSPSIDFSDAVFVKKIKL